MGVQIHPPLAASSVFFSYITARVHPSNDYAAVACSNNNQAQLHTRSDAEPRLLNSGSV